MLNCQETKYAFKVAVSINVSNYNINVIEISDLGWIKAENWFHAVTVYIWNTNNSSKCKNKFGSFSITIKLLIFLEIKIRYGS